MPRTTISVATFAACASLLFAAPVRSEPVRAALIVGNATYTSLPGIPACARSANVVAAAMRGLGFEVTERADASIGGIDAGIGEFSQRVAGKGAAFIYVCGYATDFNDRTFLLPISANIARPSDLLTQGVLAKTMLTTVSRDSETVAVVIFDLVPKPDAPKINLDALATIPVPDGVGVMAVTETTLSDRPTPLATALVSALVGPQVRTDVLLNTVRARLAPGSVGTVAAHTPVRFNLLAGAPAPAPAPPPVPVVVQPPPPVTPVPAVAPPPAPAPKPYPDEAQMSEPERREVQGALVRLGYYSLPVDGRFGPETRAAMRRYQHEIGAEMTGRLTAEQATRLVSTR